MTLSSHQRPHRGASDVWLTPPEIIEALGPFDLDPCSAIGQPWRTATIQYTEMDDGLAQPWAGFAWVNPPFGPIAETWLARLAEHGNGIALVPARTETRWFVKTIWNAADAILFLHGRPHFHRIDGSRASANSGAPICLIAYGDKAMRRLARCDLVGSLLYLEDVVDMALSGQSGTASTGWGTPTHGWCPITTTERTTCLGIRHT